MTSLRFRTQPCFHWSRLLKNAHSHGLANLSGSVPRRAFHAGGSHPFGHNPRSPLRIVDVVAVDQLDSELHAVDARFVFMVRNLTDVVLSGLRRGFKTSATRDARVIEMDLAWLAGAARAIPCGRLLVLPYELANAQPRAAGAVLARLLDGDALLQKVLADAMEASVNQHAARQAGSHDQRATGTRTSKKNTDVPLLNRFFASRSAIFDGLESPHS